MDDPVLLQALRALDARLLAACDAEERRATLLAGDARAGWEGVRNLARPPATALVTADPPAGRLVPPGHPVFDRLRAAAGLDDVACDVILVLLAPHLEPRYQSLYAVLQDNIDERRPTERLLSVLLDGADLGHRRVMSALAAGPLVRSGLVRRAPGAFPPLARPVELADDVIHALIGAGPPTLDPVTVDAPSLVPLTVHGARRAWWTTGTAPSAPPAPALQVIHGPGDGVALARSLLPRDTHLLVVDVAPSGDVVTVAQTAWRVALTTGSHVLLGLEACDAAEAEAAVGELDGLVRDVGGRAWVAARRPSMLAVPHVEALAPTWADRRRAWTEQAAARGLALAPGTADALATRHRIDAAAVADVLERVGSTDEAALDGAAYALAAVAVPSSRRAVIRRRLDDLVLNPTTRDGLERLVHYVGRRDRLAQEQGLASRHVVERGPLVLFAGRPGTGKTAAAEAVAHALRRPMFSLDLSQLMSKYIGETEKHVDEVLRAAQASAGVLFCDEADALFTSRIEKATNAGEHFANVLVGYLLQRIEVHEGTVILATNLRHAMDQAFLRRFQFRVEFPLPTPAERVRIWDLMLPDGVPRADHLDLAAVGTRSDLSGGDIANAALRAIFLADRAGEPLTQSLLEHAVALELMEQGRLSRHAAASSQAPDRGLLLRAIVDLLEERLRSALRERFLKEVHVVHGSPTDEKLAGRRPAVSLSLLRLAARRGNHGLRAGFVASAWSAYAEEEYELIGVVHEALLGLDPTEVAGRAATFRLQESSDFDLLHRFWSSHDRPVRASVVLDVEVE